VSQPDEVLPSSVQPLVRLPSGVQGLDRVLNGGLFRGGMYMIMGAPGTGKTVLANQICFSHIAEGGRAIYVTLLTESHTRLLAHLHAFSFFDQAAVGDTILFFSGYSVFVQEGIDGLYTMLRQTMRNHHASLLVLDGLDTVLMGGATELSFKAFLQRVQTIGELQQCTTLLISHQITRNSSSEQMMADGLLELTHFHIGLRMARKLEVWKLRGSAYIEGRHPCIISDSGLIVYPRTESLLKQTDTPDVVPVGMVEFGIPKLDAMLGGGQPAASISMLFGGPGTGKTILGLHFLAAGLAKGEPCLYFGFQETPSRLINKAARLGMNFNSEEASRLLTFRWHSPAENIPEALVSEMLDIIDSQGIQRLFIDGLDDILAMLFDPDRVHGFFAVVANVLRQRGITTVFAMEMRSAAPGSGAIPRIGVSETTDNIICLRSHEQDAQLVRSLSILKMRDVGYDPITRPFEIATDQGIIIADTPLRTGSAPNASTTVAEIQAETHDP
jgi:circadian clock protein KaiC